MTKSKKSLQNVIELAAEIIQEKSLKKRLAAGKKLRVKLGIDPTSPKLHIGFAVPLRMLKAFQEAGHQAVLIIGDFTAQIGDPAERDLARVQLSSREVKANQQGYLRQIGKIINLNRTEVYRNSQWLSKMGLKDFLGLLTNFSLASSWQREDFQKRLKAGREVKWHEAMYPVLQAYDSVAVKADIEIGALDQKLNLLAGRELQSALGQRPQEIIMFPYLLGLDGKKKMSKSIGNTIDLTDSASDMFGKVMSIPDELITHYAKLAAWMSPEKVKAIDWDLKRGKNPFYPKLQVAQAITELYHGKRHALASRNEFVRIFSQRLLPSRLPTIQLKHRSYRPLELLLALGVCSSKSEGRRLFAGRALEINSRVISPSVQEIKISSGDVIRVGKKKFWRAR